MGVLFNMRDFGRLTDLIRNVKSLNDGNIQILVFGNKSVKEYIIKLITIEQLFKKGEDSEGNVLGEYTGFTEELNQDRTFTVGGESAKKLAGEHYTLYDSGAFYKSYSVKEFKDGFVVLANSIKDDGTDLTRKFGINILNLSIDNKNELANFILPIIIKDIRNQITR